MPADRIGQMITFAAEVDPDATFSKYVWVKARQGDTIRAIAARRGHPENASTVLSLNKGRDILVRPRRRPHMPVHAIPRLTMTTQKLRPGASIRLPGTLAFGESLSVHAGDNPPVVTAGYAKYDIVAVPSRVGINRFLGYDPLAIDIPVQFEAYASQVGADVENDIQKLERFAGRGDYRGAANGPPAVLRISVTDNSGYVVPLIAADYQWSVQHQHAPLWRISAIVWDAGALRSPQGRRVRQTATVTVTQYTPLKLVVRSTAQRAQQKGRSSA